MILTGFKPHKLSKYFLREKLKKKMPKLIGNGERIPCLPVAAILLAVIKYLHKKEWEPEGWKCGIGASPGNHLCFSLAPFWSLSLPAFHMRRMVPTQSSSATKSTSCWESSLNDFFQNQIAVCWQSQEKELSSIPGPTERSAVRGGRAIMSWMSDQLIPAIAVRRRDVTPHLVWGQSEQCEHAVCAGTLPAQSTAHATENQHNLQQCGVRDMVG